MFGLLRRNRHQRAGAELYATAVAAARAPWFYTACGVPDTVDGRFDMVGIHACLLIRRLSRDIPPGSALAQAVFDAMFLDMDVSLREMGVSDLSVGKRVRAMWEAFHGRAAAYGRAMDAGDAAALAAAVARNVWRLAPDQETPVGAGAIAALMLAEDAALAAIPLDELARGQVGFRGPLP